MNFKSGRNPREERWWAVAFAVHALITFILSVVTAYLLLELHQLKNSVHLTQDRKTENVDKPDGPSFYKTLEKQESAEETITSPHNELVRTRRQALTTSPTCGGEVISGSNSSITSPNYPNNYPVNVTCEWIIKPDNYLSPEAYMSGTSQLLWINLAFEGTIDVEYSDECVNDRIEVRAGGDYGPLIGVYCGRDVTINDLKNDGPIYVKFVSDHSVTGRGFHITLGEAGHSTFVRWGKQTCPEGLLFYNGFAMSYMGNPGSSMKCVPFPLEVSRLSPTLTDGNVMAPVKFGNDNDYAVLDTQIQGKQLACSLCHVNRAETFIIMGWSECHSVKWKTAYTGYLMSTDSAQSEPICVDESPEVSVDEAPALSPVLHLVRSGAGFWYEDKPIPCTVCVKVYIPA